MVYLFFSSESLIAVIVKNDLNYDGPRWYRGKIMSKNESGDMEIFCLDYGNVETVAASDIQPLPREFSDLPCQAIECQLAYVGPKGEDKLMCHACDQLCLAV